MTKPPARYAQYRIALVRTIAAGSVADDRPLHLVPRIAGRSEKTKPHRSGTSQVTSLETSCPRTNECRGKIARASGSVEKGREAVSSFPKQERLPFD
jgi:hypothetical protein